MTADAPLAAPGGTSASGDSGGSASSRSRSVPRAVHIVDAPESRVHRMADLISLLGVAIGVVVVLLLGAYAQGTTQGFTTDVQGISPILQRLLVAPVNLFSGIVTLVLPAAVIIDLAVRREPTSSPQRRSMMRQMMARTMTRPQPKMQIVKRPLTTLKVSR